MMLKQQNHDSKCLFRQKIGALFFKNANGTADLGHTYILSRWCEVLQERRLFKDVSGGSIPRHKACLPTVHVPTRGGGHLVNFGLVC